VRGDDVPEGLKSRRSTLGRAEKKLSLFFLERVEVLADEDAALVAQFEQHLPVAQRLRVLREAKGPRREGESEAKASPDTKRASL
jgi:hypothetical protein